MFIETELFTYLLTPLCRVLLEKLTCLQLVKKFPAFHGTWRFITALTSVRQLSLSWASPIQSTYPHPTSWRSILILSTHLRLGLPSGLLPSGFPTKTLYTPPLLTHTRHMPSPSHSYWNWISRQIKLQYSLNFHYAYWLTSLYCWHILSFGWMNVSNNGYLYWQNFSFNL